MDAMRCIPLRDAAADPEDAAADPEDAAADPEDEGDEDDEMFGMKVGMTNIANKLPDIGAAAATSITAGMVQIAHELPYIGAAAATSISAGMVQIAHELPDIGATASQRLERAATVVSGSMERAVKYIANAAMFVVVVLVVSRHFKP
jgi:hypothetical protein